MLEPDKTNIMSVYHLIVNVINKGQKTPVVPVTAKTSSIMEDFALIVSLRRHSPEVRRTYLFLEEAGVRQALLTNVSPVVDLPEKIQVIQAHVGSAGILDSYTALVSVGHRFQNHSRLSGCSHLLYQKTTLSGTQGYSPHRIQSLPSFLSFPSVLL